MISERMQEASSDFMELIVLFVLGEGYNGGNMSHLIVATGSRMTNKIGPPHFQQF